MTDSCRMLEISNMLLRTKELNEKDQSLKRQLLISAASNNSEKEKTELVWRENGYFVDEKVTLTSQK